MSHSIFRKDGTAQGVAKQRLIESLAKPDKRIIDDLYADRFVLGASVIKLMGHKFSVWLTQKFVPGFHQHLIARTRFIDDLIKQCGKSGTEQYVILGAGYDLRAHRLALPSSLKIFEVDQAEVQARKRAKLPKGIANSENVTYVTVDFNQQSLTEQLLAAGFDRTKSSVFTLEGVSQYISKEAVTATIKEIAKLTKQTPATFFISYVDELLDEDPVTCFGKGYPKAVQRAETIKIVSAKVGEPWISFYSAEEMKALLAQNGFSLIENKTLADLNSVYFAPVGRALPEEHIFKLEHFVVASSKHTNNIEP
ncbi:class I SAM-dependent methyltransferase [uncultured Paraglaciecola sp.]|uniref:class I SAM-dependent methyltransferase n=1 Tax=uncultured Paraglaciecola sp. TaxID=1765024 RepID=UPI002626D9BE|nr:class I SAM-dependent methyltransferase [uncultured Paraglaciecola sp.]